MSEENCNCYSDFSNYAAETYEYNELGQIDKRTSARVPSVEVDYGYSIGSATSTGDLTSVNYSDTTPDESFAYDRMGRINTVTDATGTRSFEYAALGGLALSKEDLDDGFYGPAGNRDLSYAYESAGAGKVAGRFSSMGYAGVSWSQAYDSANGRISRIDASGTGFASAMQFSQSYHAGSDILHVAHYSAKGYKQERDLASWSNKVWHSKTHFSGFSDLPAHFRTVSLTTQNQVASYQLDGNADANTLVGKYRGTGNGTGAISYAPNYNSYGQLEDWNSDRTTGTDSDYNWDAAGNPTLYGGGSYEVDSLNQMDPLAAGDQWSYDADGNLTSDDTWTYGYDANNRVKSMSKSGQTLTFVYDYMGRRARKTVTGAGAVDLKFVYSGMELLAELDSSGGVRKSFHWGLDSSNTRGGAGGNMGLLMWRDHGSGESYYPIYDLSGNVAGLIDDSAAIVAHYEHDPFGRVITEGGAMMDANPIRFGTQYVDDETGLVYYGLRYYDPSKGRFVNRDPIGEAGGANLYAFVGNDPMNRVDIWGLDSVDDADKGVPVDLGTFVVTAPRDWAQVMPYVFAKFIGLWPRELVPYASYFEEELERTLANVAAEADPKENERKKLCSELKAQQSDHLGKVETASKKISLRESFIADANSYWNKDGGYLAATGRWAKNEATDIISLVAAGTPAGALSSSWDVFGAPFGGNPGGDAWDQTEFAGKIGVWGYNVTHTGYKLTTYRHNLYGRLGNQAHMFSKGGTKALGKAFLVTAAVDAGAGLTLAYQPVYMNNKYLSEEIDRHQSAIDALKIDVAGNADMAMWYERQLKENNCSDFD